MKWLEPLLIFLHAMLLLCQHSEGASPQAAAVVAVAVAVDEMLQTKTPDLPDELGGGRESQPQPVVNDVCQCGCGKTGCKCGKAAGFGCTVKSKPVLSIDDELLADIQGFKHELNVYRTHPCRFCDDIERNHGHGDRDVRLNHTGKAAPFPVTGYPIIHNPKTGQYLTGYVTMPQIRAWLKLPAVTPAKAIGAVTVGTINGEGLRAVLDQIEPAKNGGGIIKVGGASLTIPDKMPCAVGATPDKLAVGFPGPKPRLAYGSGWLGVSQTVNGITATRELLTIGLDGFPDICLRVE